MRQTYANGLLKCEICALGAALAGQLAHCRCEIVALSAHISHAKCTIWPPIPPSGQMSLFKSAFSEVGLVPAVYILRNVIAIVYDIV